MEDYKEGEELKQAQQARNICFVINDCKEHPLTSLKQEGVTWQDHFGKIFEDSEGLLKYVIVQLERGGNSDRLHLQGYCEFKIPLRYNAIKKLFGCTWMHLKKRYAKATAQQAADYCKKEDTRVEPFFEFGIISEQGKRNDLHAVVDAMKAKVPLKRIVEEHTPVFIKYHAGVTKAYAILAPATYRETITISYWYGPTAIGKSSYVRDITQDKNVYYVNDHDKSWFDGYTDENIVVFDEFQGLFDKSIMLKILDGSPVNVWVKGASVPFRAHHIFIISNKNILGMYGGGPEWTRRFSNEDNKPHKVIDLSKVYPDGYVCKARRDALRQLAEQKQEAEEYLTFNDVEWWGNSAAQEATEERERQRICDDFDAFFEEQREKANDRDDDIVDE